MKWEIPKIVAELPNYHRQYFGLIVGGKKKIYCNFFPDPPRAKESDFSYWRKDILEVCDGGYWFWNIIYDMESDACERFDVNGYA